MFTYLHLLHKNIDIYKLKTNIYKLYSIILANDCLYIYSLLIISSDTYYMFQICYDLGMLYTTYVYIQDTFYPFGRCN